MTRLNRVLTGVENVLAAGTLAAAVLIAFAQIVLRGTGMFLSWSEEAVIYLIIYSTFLGAVITLRENEHVNVDIIAVFFRRRGKQLMAILASLVTLTYLGVVGFFAWALIFEPFSFSTVTPSLKLPLWVVELSVPIGFTLMFVRALEILWRVARHGVPEDAVAEALETEASSLGISVDDLRQVSATDTADTTGTAAGTDTGTDSPHQASLGTRPDDETRKDPR